MLVGIAFQILVPWYLIDFWHREKRIRNIQVFLGCGSVRRLQIEETAEKNEEIQGRRACLEC